MGIKRYHPKADRNKVIVDLRNAGMRFCEIADKFKISTSRARQIYINRTKESPRYKSVFLDAIYKTKAVCRINAIDGLKSFYGDAIDSIDEGKLINDVNELIKMKGFGRSSFNLCLSVLRDEV